MMDSGDVLTFIVQDCSTVTEAIIWLPFLYSLMDVLPQDVMTSWSHKIRVWTILIALKFDRHLRNISQRYDYQIQLV